MKLNFLTLILFIIFNFSYSSEKPLYEFNKIENGKIIYSNHKITLNAKNNGNPITLPSEYNPPKEMFRTTWVASVENMNFPKFEMVDNKKIIRNSLSELKEDWIEILNQHEKMNFNAVIFQVSPTLDALYTSKIRPWSHVISGKQGTKPDWADNFDLMKWMIDETHKRGMEFHAWFNPYRVTHIGPKNASFKEEISKLSKDNFARKNPNFVYMFDNKLYLDPGQPEVTEHITDTVNEFLHKYDVDAIHFDDYFYPYRVSKNGTTLLFGDNFEDRETFRKYPRNHHFIKNLKTQKDYDNYDKEVKEWRRDNNNRMIMAVKSTIDKYNKKYNRSVQWGISPFGIWEHSINNNSGTDTPFNSTSSNRDIYADTRKWVLEQTIDYIIPQIYWEFNQPAAPYGEIANWWATQDKNSRTQLYIGHSSYKHMNAVKSIPWRNYEEIPNQLKFNQKYNKIKGSVFFGYNNIIYNDKNTSSLGVSTTNKHVDFLRKNYFQYKALTPAKPWLDKIITSQIKNLELNNYANSLELIFEDDIKNDSRFYIIYGFDNQNFDSSNPKNIIKIVGRDSNKNNQNILLYSNEIKNKKYIGISIKDRAGVESSLKIIALK